MEPNYALTVKLSFVPSELKYGDPIYDIFNKPRLAVIWNVRKSRHNTDQHFNESCYYMYEKLMEKLPTTILEFYEIVNKISGSREISMNELKYENSYREKYVFSEKYLKEYWEPFFRCWLNPELLNVVLPDGSSLVLSKSMSDEKESFDDYLREKESNADFEIRKNEYLDKKIKKQLNSTAKKYRICKYNEIILNSTTCPVCGDQSCVQMVAIDKVLELLRIDVKLSERDYEKM